ncbi:MAG: FHA domain-containing protein [Steroidobacteraceae bacterium]
MQSLELNDRNFAVAVGGELRSVRPSGIAVVNAHGALQGAAAWTQLRRAPNAVSTRHFSDIARHRATSATFELAVRELREIALDVSGPILGAVSARFDQQALGELLAIARSAGLELAGFIDAAVVGVARTGTTRSALVLDVGLYESSVTLVDASSGVRMRRNAVASVGWMDLLEGWLELAAEAMVKRTRFDPLHDGEHEQQIFDALIGDARIALRDGSVNVRVQKGDEVVQVQLALDQFVNAAAPFHAELLRVLQELRPPGALLDLLVPSALLELPGGGAALAGFAGCELIAVDDGAIATAASLLDAPESPERDCVRYFKRLPQGVLTGEARGFARRGVISTGAGRSPTHLLFGGDALLISTQPLIIGRAPGTDVRGVSLAEGMAGVSRCHCSVVRDGNDAVVLIDHSAHGSYVNGERVRGRARLAAGDRLRVGTPGVELSLIRVGEA